ncbi:MAG: recombinase RecT, partial [Pseudomonadota bacterium]
MTENQKKYEVAKKGPTAVEVVGQRIKALQSEGEIHFPPDYSPQNALRSAWLILQNTQDRNKKPALEVCTKASVYNALFDMVITGLNPEKKQGYFIVYGN